MKERNLLSTAHELDTIKRLDRCEWWKDICAAFGMLLLMARALYLQKDKGQYAAVSGVHLHHVTKSQDAILEELYRLKLH